MDANIDQKKRLVDGNALFRKGADPAFLKKLAGGQQPFIAILACSDSRVVPETLFTLKPGDAFVVRVAGNTAADPVVIGSLEYAVEHLRVRSILVLGHTGCGAVAAAMAPSSKETPGLKASIKEIERAKFRLPTDQQGNATLVSENNVRLQVKAIQDNSMVIGRMAVEGSLTMYGAMYDVLTGDVRFI